MNFLVISIIFEIMIFDNHIRWKNGLSPGKIPEYRGKCKRPKTERNYHKSKEKKVFDAIPDHYKPKNMDKEPRHTFIFFLGFVWYLSLPGCKFCDQILHLQKNLTEIFFYKNCSRLWNLNHEEWRKKSMCHRVKFLSIEFMASSKVWDLPPYLNLPAH